jgi:hypothetical protein
MKFNVKKIEIPCESNSFFIVNKLEFDDGVINILFKDANNRLDFSNDGYPNIQYNNPYPAFEKIELPDFPTLQIPQNISYNFKVNKNFINSDDKKLSHFNLFNLIFSKVDKEVYLIPKMERVSVIYSVFDSNKKYQGDFSLLDTGFGIADCQINPQWTLDIENQTDKFILHNYQNQYDQAYYKVYGPKKELETATKQLENHKNKMKETTNQFKTKWGYLFNKQ